MLVSQVFKTTVYQSTTSGGHVALGQRVQPLCHMLSLMPLNVYRAWISSKRGCSSLI